MALTKDSGKSRGWYVLLIAMLQEAKDNGIVQGSDSVTTTLTNLATERDKQ